MNMKMTGVLSLFLLTGCLAETTGGPVDVIPLRSPSDSKQEIRHQSRGGIFGDYTRRTPTSPSDWRKLNKEQSPGNGGAS
jgi:hypothetical protein